ncbi:hypothetical protein ACJMK2_022289 [Sinanodonta woodiana]|uniref:Protein OS-9 n=1 Tax=Sinanodonta woodiana TaxID=1069815 RepID=A0ABD3TIM2_SINWO
MITMADLMQLRLLVYVFFSVFYLTYAYLDLDELRSVQYGIDILREPVVKKAQEDYGESGVFLLSKYGQEYQCNIPSHLEQEKKKEEAEKEALEIGVPDLLKSMESAPCLIKTKDWWSYEFCYGKHIRQYHIEDGRITSEIIFLGHYESEFDWNSERKEELEKKRLHRYHTQQYVNGTKCDLTSASRRTEVRFLCEEGSGDYIHRIDEPETCKYVLTVHTTKICHHPYLKPLVAKKALPITCNPLLTVQEYQEYLDQVEAEEAEKKILEEEKKKKEEEKKKEAEEKRIKALEKARRLQEELEEKIKLKQEILESADSKTGQGETVPAATVNKLPDTAEEKEAQTDTKEPTLVDEKETSPDTKELEESADDVNVKMFVQIIDSPADLQKFLKEAMNEIDEFKTVSPVSETTLSTDKPQELGTPGEEKTIEAGTSDSDKKDMKDTDSGDEAGMIEEEEEEEEEKDLKEFSLELQKLKDKYQRHKRKLPKMTSRVKKAMEEQFEDIVKEAEEEMETDGSEISDVESRKKAFSHLASTLSNLIQRLENTEKEISAVDQELEEMAKQTDEQDFSSESGVLPPPTKTPQEQEPGKKGEDAANLKDTKSHTDKSGDNKLRVRVTRLKNGGPQPEGDKSSDSLNSESNAVTDQLQEKLTQGLRDAGVNGGKIQVKIITAGYYDDKDGKVQLMSEEDSEAFKNIIVSIIGGSADAEKEEYKHTHMQDNYNFVWQKDKKKQATASEDDGDDSNTANKIKK